MSEFGIKIKSLEAGSLYDVNRGVRDNIDMKNAMLVNSLFLDFLLSHGLSIWKNESTRDIISLSFSYGSRSYEEEVKHLKAQIDRVKRDQKISSDERERKLNIYNNLLERADRQKDLYEKKSKEEIRVHYYVNGVTVNWKTHNRSGKVIKIEPIHYRMLYRTAGKAKKGSCMFIRDELYDEALNYLRMGIQLPDHNAPIVEIGVYSSLVTSSIVGKIKINPENILILKDVDSFFKTRVVSIETDENRHCVAKTIDDYSVKNTLFDGQALIDHAFFPMWADGYILLRHHFCKMAAFDCNLQEFFKDYYGEQYKTAKVKDMFGVEHYVKNIEVVTTNNAMKWLKFDVSYEGWCDKVRENDSMFGIVKTAHKSKLGDVQRQSYQMVNSLDLDSMEAISKCSTDYIMELKSNDDVFLDYLKKNANFFNDFEVLTALVERNSDFVRSEYFRERKKTIIHNYVMNMKTGKLLQNGDNLVIIGSPYAMLLHAVGDDVEKDNTFSQEDGTIQCYTERFEDGECLAAFRSPFNSRNNMVYLHNVLNENIKKYFYIGRQCIAVNLQHTDLQARANGSDQDSDSFYVTNQLDIVDCAKRYYKEYPTIDNNIPKEENHYDNTLECFAMVDNKLAASQLSIGSSSNLAQLCLTYSYNYDDQKYNDYVCMLSVIAQASIDSAKRAFAIDIEKEIERIKNDMNVSENGFPVFWKGVQRDFNKEKINYHLNCPMNFIYNRRLKSYSPTASTIPMSEFFVKHTDKPARKTCKRVEELIEKYSLKQFFTMKEINEDDDIKSENYLLLRSDFNELVADVRNVNISKNYAGLMAWLIDRALLITTSLKNNGDNMDSCLSKNRSLLLKVLYSVNKSLFLSCFVSKQGYTQLNEA